MHRYKKYMRVLLIWHTTSDGPQERLTFNCLCLSQLSKEETEVLVHFFKQTSSSSVFFILIWNGHWLFCLSRLRVSCNSSWHCEGMISPPLSLWSSENADLTPRVGAVLRMPSKGFISLATVQDDTYSSGMDHSWTTEKCFLSVGLEARRYKPARCLHVES